MRGGPMDRGGEGGCVGTAPVSHARSGGGEFMMEDVILCSALQQTSAWPQFLSTEKVA